MRTLVSCVMVLLVGCFMAGCKTAPPPVATTQPLLSPADTQATSLTAFAVTVGALQAAPADRRDALAGQAYLIARQISQTAALGTLDAASLKDLVARQIAGNPLLAAYAVPANAAACLLIDGISAQVKTQGDPQFAAYVQAGCNGVMEATAAYAPAITK